MYRKLKHIFNKYQQLIVIAVLFVLLVNILGLYNARHSRSLVPHPQQQEDIMPFPHFPQRPQQNAQEDIRQDADQGGRDKLPADDVVNAFINGKPMKARVKPLPVAPLKPTENKLPKEEVKVEVVEKTFEKKGVVDEKADTSVREEDDYIGALGENGKPKKAAQPKGEGNRKQETQDKETNIKGGHAKSAVQDKVAKIPDTDEVKSVLPAASSFKRNCTAVENIYMLKVHKSGSTTLQNILWRWGFAHNLRMLIFPKGFPYPYLKYHETYAPPTAPDFNGKHNIMCEHSIYHKPAIQATMPKNTRNIAILREPLAQLRSAAEYYGIVHKLVGADRNASTTSQVLKTFLMDSEKYEPAVVPDDMIKVRNHVVNMFGFEDWKNVDNAPEFDKFMRRKDEEFFVLILERLSESLVLYRREMCWGTKDILTLPMRTSQAKQLEEDEDEEEEDSVEDLEMEYRAYNPGDYAVYDFFIRKIGYRIDELADKSDFWAEVRWFETVQAKTQSFCDGICRNLKGLKDRGAIKKLLAQSISFAASTWDSDFIVDGSDCLLMMFNPYLYRNAVKVVNYPQLCDPDKGGDKMDARWTLPPMFCKKDYFKYTIPWDAITDPGQYVHKCL